MPNVQQAQIVAAIEVGAGTWEMPWSSAAAGFPTNPTTAKGYRGGNVLPLWQPPSIC